MIGQVVEAFLDGWRTGFERPAPPASAPSLDLDVPLEVVHQLPAEGLWQLLRRAAMHAHRGEPPEFAASLVMAEVELEDTEVTAGEEP